ncbi:hypothetical protein AAEU32_02900 [Pseudoalteromonas sp. SSDWG2]|uniref:hypothetical protein n=1 Tax=Pseudoalteromonas sp. SSDWG2 TaxID=3139391 RepID=UPI003BA96959
MSKEEIIPDIPVDDKREAYYRACILEFERLGYRDQFLNEIFEDFEAKIKGPEAKTGTK